MTITSSGIICDVCGKYILLEKYYVFTIKGIDRAFHCHESGDCKDSLLKASEAGDWHLLPVESPIRKAFDVLAKQRDTKAGIE